MADRIQRGDNYAIPFILSWGGSPITEADFEEGGKYSALYIQFGPYVKKYEDGITYNNGKWLFPISAEETKSLDPIVMWQFCIHKGGDISYSLVYSVDVKNSLPELLQSTT